MTKILSWDVGIKNLAYCLINKNDTFTLDNWGVKYKKLFHACYYCCDKAQYKLFYNKKSVYTCHIHKINLLLTKSTNIKIKNLKVLINKNTFIIEKWGIINLAGETNKCDYHIRNNNICGNPVKFEIYNRDKKTFIEDYNTSSIFLCNNHKEKIEPNIIANKDTNIKCQKCGIKADFKVVNSDYSWCSKHDALCRNNFLKKIGTKKVSNNSCMKQSIQVTTEKLINYLDDLKDYFMTVDEVLIENQPSLKNPTMKTIASILLTYFIVRGIVEKEKNNSNINNVKFIAPSMKLTVGGSKSSEILKQGIKDKKVYALTKKLGIKYCQALINKNDFKILETYKKKDDLCDAFLQGFRYLFNPLPIRFFNILDKVGLEIK